MEAQQTHSVFLLREDLQLAHVMIRVGKEIFPMSEGTHMRALERKVVACRLSAYNEHPHVLALTAAEMKAMRIINGEYCARMAHYLATCEHNCERRYGAGVHSLEFQRQVTDSLTLYQRANRLLALFT